MADKKDALEGELLEERVIIWDPNAVSLYDESGFGTPVPETSSTRLELELVEAAYLLEKERISVFEKEGKKKKPVKFDDLLRVGAEKMLQFAAQLAVFRDLRDRGYIVKTGFKFGAHFRVYERGVKLRRGPKAPHEHTKFVVHCVPEESAFSLPEMSRAVRLAHNIRATFVWAVIDKEGSPTYYLIQRLTP